MSLSKIRPKYMHSQNIFFGAQKLVTIDHAVFSCGELTQSKLLRATILSTPPDFPARAAIPSVAESYPSHLRLAPASRSAVTSLLRHETQR